MRIFVFGNPDLSCDSVAVNLLSRLEEDFPKLEFVTVSVGHDLPLGTSQKMVILDIVQGIEEPAILTNGSIERIKSPLYSSVHEYDLGFQLKYLKKIGKIKDVTIIAIPQKLVDYDSIQSIIRKFVAHDMHGS